MSIIQQHFVIFLQKQNSVSQIKTSKERSFVLQTIERSLNLVFYCVAFFNSLVLCISYIHVLPLFVFVYIMYLAELITLYKITRFFVATEFRSNINFITSLYTVYCHSIYDSVCSLSPLQNKQKSYLEWQNYGIAVGTTMFF